MCLAWLIFSFVFKLGGPSSAQIPLPPTKTLLSGHFTHLPSGDTVRLWFSGHSLKAPVSPLGDFKLIITELPRAGFVDFSIAGQRAPLYLTPGDQLHLILDFLQFDESLHFTGRGADANNYLAQARWKFELGPGLHPQDQWTATPVQARQRANVFREQQLAFLASFAQLHPLSAELQQVATTHITLLWSRLLLRYPGNYLLLTQTAPQLPDDYYDFLRQISHDVYVTSNESSPDDNTLVDTSLQAYGYRLIPDGHLSSDPTVGERLYAQATADLGETPARDQAVYWVLEGQLATNAPAVLAAYPAFQAHNRDSSAAQGLRKALKGLEAIQRFKPGQLAPTFSLVNAAGHTVSLNDFKGKVVYLDFWGTWCAPCLAEMPASEILRQHFAGRNVVFVYISVNDTQNKWQKTLVNKQLSKFQPVQLWSPNMSTANAYLVQEYPSYYLIGQDGRLLSTHPPRPSDSKKAIAAIEQALKQ